MQRTARKSTRWLRSLVYILLVSLLMTSCQAGSNLVSGAPLKTPETVRSEGKTEGDCPETSPTWVKPPEDSAVLDEPAYSYYIVNEDQSIWASAWYSGEEKYNLHATEEGNKVGWFRPEGAQMEITGRRIDGEAPPMQAEIPCCYPTRFQATGLYFPEPGCWEITAKAGGSQLTFVVTVEP